MDARAHREDVTATALPGAGIDLWHDRAVFHFLTAAGRRRAYVERGSRALRPGGSQVVSTLGPSGPVKQFLSCWYRFS